MKRQKAKETFVSFDGRINPAAKERLRQKIKSLDSVEVRRCRIPFHEALLAELREDNLKNAFEFFKELIQYDLEEVQILTKDHKLMEIIFNELKKMECDIKETEIEILVKLGKLIEDMNDIKLHWLVDKIYSHSLAMVINSRLEGTRIDAIGKYFYGNFLSGIESRLQEAIIFLDKALEISSGHDEWEIEMQPIYKLVSLGMSKTMIKLSKKIRFEHPEKSLELAEKSLKVVRNNEEAGSLEVEALIELGNCFLSTGFPLKAYHQYALAVEVSKSRNQHDLALEGMLKISECFKNDYSKYEQALHDAINYAKSNRILEPAADILVALGQFMISRKEYTTALNFFNDALTIYEQTAQKKKLRNVHFLMAPLRAQSTFNDLVDTILKCDKGIPGKNSHLCRLLLWHDRKNPTMNKYHECYQEVEGDSNVEAFVKKYYDPDEITRISQ